MYPGDSEPDYGVFVRGLEQALTARGHTIERAVLTSRRGGKAKYARLASRSIFAARRTRPDVVYAHFLVPTGLLAGLASRAPLVVTAHGQDVANIGSIPGVRAGTKRRYRPRAATPKSSTAASTWSASARRRRLTAHRPSSASAR